MLVVACISAFFACSKRVASSFAGVVCGPIRSSRFHAWLLADVHLDAVQAPTVAVSLLQLCHALIEHIHSLPSFCSHILSVLFSTVFSSHRGSSVNILFKAKHTVLIYLNIFSSHECLYSHTLYLCRIVVGWRVCCGKGLDTLPVHYGDPAGWQQPFTASSRRNLDFLLYENWLKESWLAYSSICQHLCGDSWHFKNTWLRIILKY